MANLLCRNPLFTIAQPYAGLIGFEEVSGERDERIGWNPLPGVDAAQDPVTPPEVTSKLAEGIPGADHVVVDDAAHIVNIAQPEAFGTAVEEHLDRTVGA